MKLIKYRSVTIILFLMVAWIIDVLAVDSEINIDPMAPKVPLPVEVVQKPVVEEKAMVLNAIGYNGEDIYCVVNGSLMQIDDMIDEYKIEEINEDEITLSKKNGEIKKLIVE